MLQPIRGEKCILIRKVPLLSPKMLQFSVNGFLGKPRLQDFSSCERSSQA